MGPLVTQRLLLMDQYNLRCLPSELFGKEAGQEVGWKKDHVQHYNARKGPMPGEKNIQDCESDIRAPKVEAYIETYAATARQHLLEKRQHDAGWTRAYPQDLKTRVTAEAKAAWKKAKYGGRQAAIRTVAERHGMSYATVMAWVRGR